MNQRTFLIVGGTDGIGRALANILVNQNRVIIVGRSQAKGQAFMEDFGNNAHFFQSDVSLMSNTETVCKKLILSEEKLDFIIHTADILQTVGENTKEGLEKSIAINFYSRVLFNELLLKKFQPERIIHVAAAGFPMNKNFNNKFPIKDTASGFSAHGYGQIANDYYGLWMSKQLLPTKINILNPGIVDTDIRRNAKMGGMYKFAMPIIGFFMARNQVSPEEYAKIVFNIIRNNNDESNHFVLINNKGKGIRGNRHINNIEIQQYVYESAIKGLQKIVGAFV
ncbi:MAG: SDR family NAD(P)-dependent oxidoreductase [Bacteroidota bacterium]